MCKDVYERVKAFSQTRGFEKIEQNKKFPLASIPFVLRLLFIVLPFPIKIKSIYGKGGYAEDPLPQK